MQTVRFHIYRKAAFAGCVLPYRLFINGDAVGTLQNGQTLEATVPRARLYFIDEAWSFDERNGYFEDDGAEEYFITIKRAGGWRTDSYKEFYKGAADSMRCLPSFSYDRLRSAAFCDDEFARLSEGEKVLARGLEFEAALCDDIDALLRGEHCREALAALQTIGAEALYQEITAYIAGQPSANVERLFEERSAQEALHQCLARYLAENILLQ